MIFAGGIPLKKDGKVVGAIGVSGGSGEQDHAVAEAGAGVVTRSERQPRDGSGSAFMASNRGVVYLGPGKVEVQSIDFPKMPAPDGEATSITA